MKYWLIHGGEPEHDPHESMRRLSRPSQTAERFAYLVLDGTVIAGSLT